MVSDVRRGLIVIYKDTGSGLIFSEVRVSKDMLMKHYVSRYDWFRVIEREPEISTMVVGIPKEYTWCGAVG